MVGVEGGGWGGFVIGDGIVGRFMVCKVFERVECGCFFGICVV